MLASYNLTRRQWVAGAAGTTLLTGCGTAPTPGKLAPVSILRAASYSEDLYALMQRIITEHRLDVRGKRVVLKPNLVEFDQNTVINTHPKMVHAALRPSEPLGRPMCVLPRGPGTAA